MPLEVIDSAEDDTGRHLVVTRKAGSASALRYIRLTNPQGELAFGTEGQIFGAPAAEHAFAIGAVNVASAGGGQFTGGTSNPVEHYSSDGPRRIFYEADGSPITPGNFLSTGGELRQKPDYAAATGVSTAAPGLGIFEGTSAAAPHAAAIAALFLEMNPDPTIQELRDAFNGASLDIEGAGMDRDSGAGIIRADLLLANFADIFRDGFETGDFSAWSTTVP